tara:strand:- start:403 stop:1404 length:1002 start_codon:yes stop_codon:yes gene_type:complete
MAASTPNWVGRVNAAAGSYSTTFATQKALFLKLFAGEVLTAFEEQNVMLPVTTVRTINSGKTAQFPALGRTTAEYHTPGAEILGGNIKTNEVTINIDDLLISSVFIDSLEEAMNHYDVRGPYAQEIGAALAKRMDQNLLRLVDIGANVSLKPATVTGMEAGQTVDIEGADMTDGDVVAAKIFQAAQKFDENFIPQDNRYAVLPPSMFYALIQSAKAVNRDWSPNASGSYQGGAVTQVAGVNILKSNHIQTTNYTAVDGENNSYVDGTNTANEPDNFASTSFLAFHSSGVGTVKLKDISIEAEYDMRRQGTLMVAKCAVGHGVLRPESCIKFYT